LLESKASPNASVPVAGEKLAGGLMEPLPFIYLSVFAIPMDFVLRFNLQRAIVVFQVLTNSATSTLFYFIFMRNLLNYYLFSNF